MVASVTFLVRWFPLITVVVYTVDPNKPNVNTKIATNNSSKLNPFLSEQIFTKPNLNPIMVTLG